MINIIVGKKANPVSSGFGRHPHEVYVLRTCGLNPVPNARLTG